MRAKRLNAEQLLQYALNALGRRALAAGELRQRLALRAAEESDIEPAIRKLKDLGFLDDKQFAENYARARLDNQGLGSRRVLQDLRRRRVAPKVAETAVSDTYGGTDETGLIEDFLARKFRNVKMKEYLADPNHLSSAYRKLLYAGFSPGASIRVLKGYSSRAEELDTEIS